MKVGSRGPCAGPSISSKEVIALSHVIQILVADDEDRLRRLVGDFLKREGFTVLEAKDGGEALRIVEEKGDELSLVVLDVMMPVLDGWKTLRQIKSRYPSLPVVMLTARTEEADEIFGFELGADDYVGKPFSPIVLTARIKALLRKSAEPDAALPKTFGSLTIDELGRIVTLEGRRLDLSPKEYELLVYLADNRNVALSRDQILNAVWGYDYFGDLRTVDTHIKKIRAKLGDWGRVIRTVRSYGYRFELDEEDGK
ncbi:MAG: response regulator transcription factor [Clostridia bacterium]|nr:response regulator transcription factor [Clostridia bacterium]